MQRCKESSVDITHPLTDRGERPRRRRPRLQTILRAARSGFGEPPRGMSRAVCLLPLPGNSPADLRDLDGAVELDPRWGLDDLDGAGHPAAVALGGDPARGDLLPPQRLSRPVQGRLVPLGSEDVVPNGLDDELGGVGLCLHCINGDRHVGEVELGEQRADSGGRRGWPLPSIAITRRWIDHVGAGPHPGREDRVEPGRVQPGERATDRGLRGPRWRPEPSSARRSWSASATHWPIAANDFAPATSAATATARIPGRLCRTPVGSEGRALWPTAPKH
jgi:hypothetical protein